MNIDPMSVLSQADEIERLPTYNLFQKILRDAGSFITRGAISSSEDKEEERDTKYRKRVSDSLNLITGRFSNPEGENWVDQDKNKIHDRLDTLNHLLDRYKDPRAQSEILDYNLGGLMDISSTAEIRNANNPIIGIADQAERDRAVDEFQQKEQIRTMEQDKRLTALGKNARDSSVREYETWRANLKLNSDKDLATFRNDLRQQEIYKEHDNKMAQIREQAEQDAVTVLDEQQHDIFMAQVDDANERVKGVGTMRRLFDTLHDTVGRPVAFEIDKAGMSELDEAIFLGYETRHEGGRTFLVLPGYEDIMLENIDNDSFWLMNKDLYDKSHNVAEMFESSITSGASPEWDNLLNAIVNSVFSPFGLNKILGTADEIGFLNRKEVARSIATLGAAQDFNDRINEKELIMLQNNLRDFYNAPDAKRAFIAINRLVRDLKSRFMDFGQMADYLDETIGEKGKEPYYRNAYQIPSEEEIFRYWEKQ